MRPPSGSPFSWICSVRRTTVLMGRMLLEHRRGQAGEAETGTGGESGDV